MDDVTLKLLADEVEEGAEWFGDEYGTAAINVGIGIVVANRDLTREDTGTLIGELNRRIRKEQQNQNAEYMIQSAIRNVN